mmetsp:Transcript_21974/g.32456  ORF Transcript_21974/g.32456 Transcript_21974/m.32456 type:complete len:430 (+) Transcript_21974:59-1348(+)
MGSDKGNIKSDDQRDEIIREKNLKYYVEYQSYGCCRRILEELVVHPYTVMEVTGKVVDVQKTFDFKPVWLAWIFKGICLGLAITTVVFDLVFYTGDYNFYMAYLESWFLVFAVLYLFLSFMITVSCGFPRQPVLGEDRTNWNVCFTWAFYPVVFCIGMANMLQYWFFTSDEDGFIRDIDYFAIIKNAALPLLLLIEGQLINRIPIRFSHLPWSQLAFVVYMIWSMIHYNTDIGNPDLNPTQQVDVARTTSSKAFGDPTKDYRDLPIYSWLDWSIEERGNTALYCGVILGAIVPVCFLILYLISWPCRRYYNLDPSDDGSSSSNSEAGGEEMPDEVELILFPSSMGMRFNKSTPPKVTQINDDSPYAEPTDTNPVAVKEGMVVDTFTVGDETYAELTTKELVTLIKETKDIGETRIMRCINPETMEVTKG